MPIASLSIDLTARVAQLQTDLGKANYLVEKSVADMERTFGRIKTAVAGLGIAAAITQQLNGVKAAIDKLDAFDDLSEKYGIAADKLSAYTYAAEVAGTSSEAFATGVNKLAKNMAEAAGGSREQAAAFKSIGVEVKTADGALRSVDDVLLDVANKFSTYQDGAGKAALAIAIFGKSGADLLPLLNKGGEGIAQLTAEAKAFGLIVGNDAAKAAGDLNDNIKRLELAAQSAKLELATQLLPTLVAITNQLIEGRKAYGGFLSATVDIGLNVNPFKSLKENIAATTAELQKEQSALADLDARAARIASGTGSLGDRFNDIGGDTQRAKMRDEIALLGKRLQYLQKTNEFQTRVDKESIYGAPGGSVKVDAPVINKKPDHSEDEAKRAKKAYDDLIESVNGRIEVTQQEIDTGEKASEADTLRIQILKKLDDADIHFTAGQRSAILALSERAQAVLRTNEQQRESTRLLQEAARAVAQQLTSYDDTTRALRDQLQEIGLNTQQLEALRIKRLEDAVAAREERLAVEELFGATQDQIDQEKLLIESMKSGVEARKAIARATDDQATNATAGATAAIDEYVRVAGEAGTATRDAVSSGLSTLEDDLTRSLAGGKLNVHSFVEYVKAEVFRLAVVRPFLAQVFEGFGEGGSGGQSGIGGLLSKFIGSIYNYNGSTGGINGSSTILPHSLRGGGATGTNLLERDMITLVHKGEAIIPKAYNPAANPRAVQAGGASNATNVVNNISVGAGVSRGEVFSMMNAFGQQIKGEILNSIRNKGAFSH